MSHRIAPFDSLQPSNEIQYGDENKNKFMYRLESDAMFLRSFFNLGP